MLEKVQKLAAVTGVVLAAFAGAAQAEPVFLSPARLVDVRNERLVENPVIVVEEGRITQVGSAETLKIPAGAKALALPGVTLLPGLMDMHTHITSSHNDHGYRALAISVPSEAIKGVAHAQTTLLAGVTTIRNVGAGGFTDVALRDAVNAGEVPGPRMFVSGPALGITGGHCDNNLLPNQYTSTAEGVADGPWEVRKKVRENIKYGVDLIKFCATGGVMSKGTKVGIQQYTLEEMQAIVDEAHRRGITVAAHAHGTEGIKTAIRAGVDSVEHASFLDKEAIRLAKKHGTYFSMDIYNTEFILSEGEAAGILPESLEKERHTGGRQRQSFTMAVKAGVKIVFGTDAAIYPHGDNARQLSRMVKFGMTPMQALQAATINAADLLKQSENLGALETGKYADIIGVKGNPLEDISLLESVDFVMKNGVVYKNRVKEAGL